MAHLKVENITYTYPASSSPALDHVNLEIEAGEFVLLVGGSGSGKSSLIRVLAGLAPEFYGGSLSGNVIIDDQNMRTLNPKAMTEKIGVVFQDPESQLVMNGVEDELAFGLENIGLAKGLMRRRIMETRSALNLSPFMECPIPLLSGGQKQKVALGSILAMQPEVLILDEPTSQLDPIAGEDILTMVRRLNEENGITVILTEQRLERCYHLADRIIVMDHGKVVMDHRCKEHVARWAKAENNRFLPPVVRLFSDLGTMTIPSTVKEGRALLRQMICSDIVEEKQNSNSSIINKKALMDVNNLWFAYDDNEVLKHVNLTLYPGECVVLLGENGGGKTHFLN